MYNEQAGARECVTQISAVLVTLPNRCELIVVNDGSTDETGAVLAECGSEEKLTVVSHPENRGYGAALSTGVHRATESDYEYVLFMDSDLTNHPSDLPRFAIAMRSGADVIKATRYSSGGAVRGVPFYRLAISRVGNWIARLLFRLPVHDCTNGYRAVKSRLLIQMELRETRFPIILEELYWCKFLDATYVEVPVTLTNRGVRQRPTSFAYRPRVFFDYLRYPLRASLGLRPTNTRKSL